ncbi:MAG: hypothetical protein LBK58_11850 [Prevotellaceae bacterium]|nr:hypothetical protein [Prevotellaceae bacterium]
MIENMRKLPAGIIERFLETRDAKKLGVPPKLAEYILQINEASNLHRRIHSIADCAVRLQKSYPELSISTCKSRIYDAINYLNSDCTVTTEAWNLFYADQMTKLMEVNLVAQNLKEARICMELARKYRIEASANAVNPDLLKFKHQFVTPDINIERMGVQKQGLLPAYRNALKIIDVLEIPDAEKDRLIREVENETNISSTDEIKTQGRNI